MSKGLSTLVRGLGLAPGLAQFLEDIQRNLREVRGIGVTNEDALYVTQGDLVRFGIGARDNSGALTIGASSSTEAFDATPPLPPSNLVASGGYAQILLQWAAPNDSKRGYFEIFRNTVDNLTTAVKIAQTTSFVYGDELQASTSVFYWVRSVSRFSDTIVSAFNATGGTAGQTSPDLDYVLSVMTGADPAQPFYYLASDTTIGGVLVPAGTYIKSLYALAATVSLFRAGLAVIDNANIISLNAEKIVAGTMSADRLETNSLVAKLGTFDAGQFGTIFANKAYLTSAMINSHLQSDNFNGNPSANDPGTAGWYIGRDGKFYGSGVTVSGTINASTFNGGAFFGGSFSGGSFTGGLVQSPNFMGNYVPPAGSRFNLINGRSAFWDLAAQGTNLAFHINGKFRVFADGLVEIDEPVISKSNVLASGTKGTQGTRLVFWDLSGSAAPPPYSPGTDGA